MSASRRWLRLLLSVSVTAAACHDGPTDPGTDGPAEPDPYVVAMPDAALLSAGATITAQDVASRVGVLADDSMRGRLTGRPELETAASYIAGTLADAGIEPAGTDGFLQRFDFAYPFLDTTDVVLELAGGDGPALRRGRDYIVIGSFPGDTSGVVLWGGAPEATPAAGGLPLTGRVVLYDLPTSRLDIPDLSALGAADGAAYQGRAAAYGFVVPETFTEERMAEAAGFTGSWTRAVPMFFIREPAADALLAAAGETDVAALRAGDPRDLDVSLHVRGTLMQLSFTPPNVVGVLPGSDPALRDEYVVVSAHYDHIGTGIPDATGDSIANGADDNASGTSAVLEVAEALASLETPPARSVLFLLVSGEEEGLLGSFAFIQDPTVPLSSMVADINLDMVGRNDPGEIIGVGSAFTTLGGAATALADSVDALGLQVVPDLVPQEHLFLRSDQLAFVCRQVPALFLNSGLHADYHRPSDELEKLDTDKVARVARLALYLAHLVADAADTPSWTVAGQAELDHLGACF
ncbi:MAG: M28 family peptidase [Gemmatimonadota bacterium]|jgi:hypothetical protein